jgi:DNA ligase-1
VYLSELTAVVDALAGTRSRRALVEHVARLLERAAPEDREPIVYLLQGRLRPAYEPVDVGLGERTLSAVLAEAYGASAATVASRLARRGDLGSVAQSLAPGGPRRRLTVRQAYDGLLAVARATGRGSTERKRALLAALLRAASGPGARLLVRVAQGRLRLGVGDQTILEAAAVAALGDARRKPLLEHAYNVRSDLAAVVALAFTKGARALAAVGPKVGVPVRPALAQRLPSAEAIVARLGAVQAEPKYDGFRLQLHRDGDRVRAFSRRLEDVTGMFPELADAVCRQLRARRAILEGEAVVYDPASGAYLPFQVTMTRKRKTGVAEAALEHPLRLFAFDLLSADGRSWLARPQRERSARLRELLPFAEGDAVAVADALVTDRAVALRRYFEAMLRRGLEGIVAKRLDAPYHPGARGYDWVKLKRGSQEGLRDTVDAVIVGYLRGRGKRAALGIGSLLVAVYDPEGDRFRTVAKVGSGLSEAGWRALRARLDEDAVEAKPPRVDSLISPDVWVEPCHVVEVRADEVTRSPRHTCGRSGDAPGYALRFPRVVRGGVRADKAATDATTEREILDLFRLQRAVGGGVRADRHAIPDTTAHGAR